MSAKYMQRTSEAKNNIGVTNETAPIKDMSTPRISGQGMNASMTSSVLLTVLTANDKHKSQQQLYNSVIDTNMIDL